MRVQRHRFFGNVGEVESRFPDLLMPFSEKYLQRLSMPWEAELLLKHTRKFLSSLHFFSLKERDPVQFSSRLGIRPELWKRIQIAWRSSEEPSTINRRTLRDSVMRRARNPYPIEHCLG